MILTQNRTARLILLSLFVTSVGSSAIIPFMGFFIMEGLGKTALHITLYSVTASLMTVAGTRFVGGRIDRGDRIFPYVILANFGLLAAAGAVALKPAYLTVMLAAGPGLAIASSGQSAIYSLGRLYAERTGLDVARYNALVRTMVSMGWMFGPALSYAVAARYGNVAVFEIVVLLALAALVTAVLVLPRDFSAAPRPDSRKADARLFDNSPLWLAAGACFLFAVAHVLCTSALPLFYTREAHLPIYAPGLSLTFKCLAEVIAILASPLIMARIGRRNALYVSGGLALAAFLVLHQTTNLTLMAAGALLEGCYYGLFAGVAVTFMQGFARGRIGHATSLYMNSLFVGSLSANMMIGAIASLFNFRTAIVAAALAMTAALAMLFLSRRADAEAET
jgi:MFS transporter, SET family, sugar efflux transporter